MASSGERATRRGRSRDAVDALGAAGCDELFLVPTTTDVAELDRTREALGI